jgi:hypothetical protein
MRTAGRKITAVVKSIKDSVVRKLKRKVEDRDNVEIYRKWIEGLRKIGDRKMNPLELDYFKEGLRRSAKNGMNDSVRLKYLKLCSDLKIDMTAGSIFGESSKRIKPSVDEYEEFIGGESLSATSQQEGIGEAKPPEEKVFKERVSDDVSWGTITPRCKGYSGIIPKEIVSDMPHGSYQNEGGYPFIHLGAISAEDEKIYFSEDNTKKWNKEDEEYLTGMEMHCDFDGSGNSACKDCIIYHINLMVKRQKESEGDRGMACKTLGQIEKEEMLKKRRRERERSHLYKWYEENFPGREDEEEDDPNAYLGDDDKWMLHPRYVRRMDNFYIKLLSEKKKEE